MAKINVKNTEITVFAQNDTDFISLTDMSAGFKEGSALIGKWITNKNTLEYLGIWEKINNPDFNYPEFGVIENNAGINRFVMSVGQWIERTQAKGLLVKAGRYGGTFAHKDIAFHFAMWLSPEFQIYLIKEFQHLKEEEQKQVGWSVQRELAKMNYHIHSDAVQQFLAPATLTSLQKNMVYASEADVLNVALFGKTAKQWREQNPTSKGNIRDYAGINELICLSNLENLNAVWIQENIAQTKRLVKLNLVAIHQMNILKEVETKKYLK
ncbi:MAG: KilA-N domain-containing protein [Lutibacter sp.]|nr:KilA-N domain-containing protein [Lutibacter sp.]